MTTEQKFSRGDAVTVDGYEGVAWRIEGPHTTRQEIWGHEWKCEDQECEGCEPFGEFEDVVTEGAWDCHMVGDDRTFTFDEHVLHAIDDDDFCSSCGQIGCGHG